MIAPWIQTLRILGISFAGFTAGLYALLGPKLVQARRKGGFHPRSVLGITLVCIGVQGAMLVGIIDLAARWNHVDFSWRSPVYIATGAVFSIGLLLLHKYSVINDKEG